MQTGVLLGANGQLGTDIQKVFEGSAEHIIPVYRKHLDLENYGQIQSYLKDIDFDFIINCTGYHKTDECEDFPAIAFSVNAFAVWELAKLCQSRGKTLFHVSTDYVFGGERTVPYREEDIANPLNVYGNSKLVGERMLSAYHDKFFIFRVSSLFGQAGASAKGGNFVETMLRLARDGKPIRVIHDQVMSPTHTLDIAHAVKHFIDQDIRDYGIYHCSGEGQCSWYTFTTEIFRQMNVDVSVDPVPHTQFPTRARRPLYSVLGNDKINHIYQMPLWQDALNSYLRIKGYLT